MPGLLDHIAIRHLVLTNRIVMPPMASNLATEAGEVTDRLLDHYRSRAAEVGLLMVEHSYVSPEGRYSQRQTGIHQDELLPRLKELVQAVHQAGGAAGIQLAHAGGRAQQAVIGRQPVTASPVKSPRGTEDPRPLSREEMDQLLGAYTRAAIRAVEAGFDVIEVHGAHGYLLNEFLSPLTNMRTDEWGGSRENRLRFPLQVVEAVRMAIGSNKLLFFRLGADDRLPGGMTLEDGVWNAKQLQESGVDVIDLSGGHCGYIDLKGQGFFAYMGDAMKKAGIGPVVVTGGIHEPAFADTLVREGQADLVGIGRAMLQEADWAQRAIRELRPSRNRA